MSNVEEDDRATVEEREAARTDRASGRIEGVRIAVPPVAPVEPQPPRAQNPKQRTDIAPGSRFKWSPKSEYRVLTSCAMSNEQRKRTNVFGEEEDESLAPKKTK